ncbi:methyltransferase [Chrysiogenes arsenatis]|uniref:methyltransferase n=1 Tax=Chrysiogenes arsenatis TaxID=309797 RepID=UPI0003FE15DD|nr:methyltransferase [Chrysiogenes arsenatis]
MNRHNSPRHSDSAVPEQIFSCLEESVFYALCIEHLLLPHIPSGAALVEFGSGDGTPVIEALQKAPDFAGTITGYELNLRAYALCQANITAANLGSKYHVQAGSFFEKPSFEAFALLANPPYIPFPDASIRLPYLHGGLHGSEVTTQLLREPYPMSLLLVSSYSNPLGIIDTAHHHGLCVANFLIMPIRYGDYSREPKVFAHIMTLREQGFAYASANGYLLAGVLFARKEYCHTERCNELKRIMRSADDHHMVRV